MMDDKDHASAPEQDEFERRFPRLAALHEMDDEQLVQSYDEALQRLRHELDGIET